MNEIDWTPMTSALHHQMSLLTKSVEKWKNSESFLANINLLQKNMQTMLNRMDFFEPLIKALQEPNVLEYIATDDTTFEDIPELILDADTASLDGNEFITRDELSELIKGFGKQFEDEASKNDKRHQEVTHMLKCIKADAEPKEMRWINFLASVIGILHVFTCSAEAPELLRHQPNSSYETERIEEILPIIEDIPMLQAEDCGNDVDDKTWS